MNKKEIFKIHNRKRRWRRINKLEGFSNKQNKEFSDFDLEYKKEFEKVNIKYFNTDWRQNPLNKSNTYSGVSLFRKGSFYEKKT